jgi:hypothetical protein
MTDFGAGPYLTKDLDFEITTTGDIRTTSGVAELEKDIALQSLINLRNEIGVRDTPQNRARFRSQVRDILLADPRINRVTSVSVTFSRRNEAAEIIADVITDNTEQELVFEVA